jgi:hypothetical protein
MPSTNGIVNLPFCICNTKTVNFNQVHKWVIGEVRGSWTGTILERKIIGSNFTFLGQYIFVVNCGSRIESDVKDLYEDGHHYQLCNLIKLMAEANNGYLDDSIKHYL